MHCNDSGQRTLCLYGVTMSETQSLQFVWCQTVTVRVLEPPVCQAPALCDEGSPGPTPPWPLSGSPAPYDTVCY